MLRPPPDAALPASREEVRTASPCEAPLWLRTTGPFLISRTSPRSFKRSLLVHEPRLTSPSFPDGAGVLVVTLGVTQSDAREMASCMRDALLRTSQNVLNSKPALRPITRISTRSPDPNTTSRIATSAIDVGHHSAAKMVPIGRRYRDEESATWARHHPDARQAATALPLRVRRQGDPLGRDPVAVAPSSATAGSLTNTTTVDRLPIALCRERSEVVAQFVDPDLGGGFEDVKLLHHARADLVRGPPQLPSRLGRRHLRQRGGPSRDHG